MTRKALASFSALFLISFVSVAQTKVESREILEKINQSEPVEYRGVEIVGDLDLTQLTNQHPEPRENTSNQFQFYVKTVEVPFRFTDCTFTGNIITTRQAQARAIHYTNFSREVALQNCTFRGVMVFRHVTFSNRVTFEGSQFQREANFIHTVFSTRPIFKSVTFAEAANFRHTKFNQGVDFTKAAFKRANDFRHTNFAEGVSFANGTFDEAADFTHAEFSARAQWRGISFRPGVHSEYAQVNGRRYDLSPEIESDR